jgi:hypothetical protein
VAVPCEHGNETSGSVTFWEFLQLRNYQLHKDYSAPWNYVKFIARAVKTTKVQHEEKLRGFGPQANYADQATAAFWRSSANFCG